MKYSYKIRRALFDKQKRPNYEEDRIIFLLLHIIFFNYFLFVGDDKT